MKGFIELGKTFETNAEVFSALEQPTENKRMRIVEVYYALNEQFQNDEYVRF